MLTPARAMWRYLHRDGGDYVFAEWRGLGELKRFHRIPVERFWGGAR